ncbi:MAG: S1C family serine protease, partial [Victivallaceae bacterium]|nr:S1C family serine protease [Victivallaceae bacterium]
MKRILFSLMLFACLCSAAEVNPLNAVVRVDAMGNIPSFLVPWQSSATSWSGSAVVIEGRRILTNAHNVAWATFITLTKQNDDTPYEAKVQHVSHDNDLALLTAEDERFFDDIVPMALGPTPPPQSSVLVAGYPVGGTSMSLTRGIVSRIEMTFYKQSSKLQLGTQLDAAINSGNSGGPVLFDGKVVGIAFQGLNSSKADGIGYMIPYEVIDQFFKDIKDNRIDGIGTLGFDCAVLVNAGARHYLGMDERQTGVVVWNVDPGTDGSLVKKNDVVLSANGHRITNVGNIMLPDGSLRHWLSIVTLGQIGDVVHLELLRDGKVVKSDVPIRKFHIVVREYEHMPSYVLYNGMVFT